MHRRDGLLYGKGYIREDYIQKRKDGWYCPYYRRWHSLMQRSYSEAFARNRPTYERTEVCKEWHNFHTFREWMVQQDWEGKDLDKDILCHDVDIKVYSPDTCAFISRELNSFFTLRQRDRGPYPLGVHCLKGVRFIARCMVDGKRRQLGTFTTPEEAHLAWQNCKLEYGRELITRQTDERIVKALGEIFDKLQQQISCKEETIHLLQ